jgi:DNA-binding CsgD family transcriptional regulator
VEALAAAGRTAEAEDLVKDFERGLGARPIPSAHAALHACNAVMIEQLGTSAESAATAWAAAARSWQSLPRPYDALLAREREARCLFWAGERARALSQWADLTRSFMALGAKRDAERVEQTGREHGAMSKVQRRAGRIGYGGQLSPREREVVELLLQGMTNREIAIALSRSPKTVEAQLGNAKRKYGVTTRTALAVMFARNQSTTSEIDRPETRNRAGSSD